MCKQFDSLRFEIKYLKDIPYREKSVSAWAGWTFPFRKKQNIYIFLLIVGCVFVCSTYSMLFNICLFEKKHRHIYCMHFTKHVLCVCVRSSFAGAPPSHPMDIVMVVRQRMGSKRYHQIALCIPGRSIPALRARISTQPSGIFPRKVLSKTNQLQIIRRTDEVFQKGHISEPCLTNYMLFVFSSHHVVCFLLL